MQALITQKARPLHACMEWRGLQISIENRPGSVRRGIDPDGNPWETVMHWPYGYILGSTGADGDHVDCYLGPHLHAPNVYVIRIKKPPDFVDDDEDKAFLGFPTPQAAREALIAQYDNPRFYGSMTTMPFDEFKEKVLATRGDPALLKARVRQ